MKQDQIEEGRLSEMGHGMGTVTEEMVQQRAREIAIINGRAPEEMSSSDREQAYRELTGASRLVEESAEESLPNAARWDPVPGTSGKKAPVVPAHDEQTDNEKLTEEGIADAEHDQMVEATVESLEKDKRLS